MEHYNHPNNLQYDVAAASYENVAENQYQSMERQVDMDKNGTGYFSNDFEALQQAQVPTVITHQQQIESIPMEVLPEVPEVESVSEPMQDEISKPEEPISEEQPVPEVTSENAQDVAVEPSEAAPVAEPSPAPPPQPKVDPDQCRACKSKENLISIFDLRAELNLNIAELIVGLCHNVRISEKDLLPHLICNDCVETVIKAHSFKIKCESTDKEFRSNLRRSENKRRATRQDYVLLDATKDLESSSEDEGSKVDDDEFKVSDVEAQLTSDGPSDEDSDFVLESKKKKKPKSTTRKKRAPRKVKEPVQPVKRKGRKRKNDSTESAPTPVQKKSGPPTKNVVYIDAGDASSDDETLKKKRTRKMEQKPPVVTKSVTKVKTIVTPKKIFAPTKTTAKTPIMVQSQKSLRKKEPREGRDLFKTCAPITTTYWSDSFSD